MSPPYDIIVAVGNIRKKETRFNQMFLSDIATTVSTCVDARKHIPHPISKVFL